MTVKLIIEVELEGDAFQDESGHEIARVLGELAVEAPALVRMNRRIEDPKHAVTGWTRKLFDVNGNHCGIARMEDV